MYSENWLFQHKNLKSKPSSELSIISKIFAGGNAPCLPPTGPSHLQNLTQKCMILDVVWA